jgi:hypothetical protein
MAHCVDLLRCEGSDAMGAKRTCRERRERVDLTKMTHLGSGVCIAAPVMLPRIRAPSEREIGHRPACPGVILCRLFHLGGAFPSQDGAVRN